MDSIQGIIKNEITQEPIWALEKDIYYYYISKDDLFSKNFVFRIIKEFHDEYLISVEEKFQTFLPKSYNLIDAINNKTIRSLGTAKDAGINFNMKDELDDLENIDDYLERIKQEIKDEDKND